MSMPVPYTPPEYVPPEVARDEWSGRDRRSRDPVNQLARSFNKLCLEATDRFEIVAHLEALGINDPATLRILGVDNHFDLAKSMYARTPRVFSRAEPKAVPEAEWQGSLATVLTLVATFALGGFADAAVLAPALWVLVWSQASAALLAHTPGELFSAEQSGVLSALMWVGLLGLPVVWLLAPFGLEVAAPAMLWYALAGLLWSRHFKRALALPLSAGFALGSGVGLGLDPEAAMAATLVGATVVAAPLLWRPTLASLSWLARHGRLATQPTLYGIGQALLIVALLRQSPADAEILAGAGLLALILLTFRSLLLRLKQELVNRLWSNTRGSRFVASVRAAVLEHAAVYLMPMLLAVPVALLIEPAPWAFHWYAFALFGLVLALAVVALTLGDARTAGVSFLVAGLAAQVFPFMVVCALLAVVQLALLLRFTGRVERYADYLL